ncbi:MAG TPA: hypothetical protein VN153_03945 [Tahibacter sp.]|nr:hypothetical protein [Tahibacter sp.]
MIEPSPSRGLIPANLESLASYRGRIAGGSAAAKKKTLPFKGRVWVGMGCRAVVIAIAASTALIFVERALNRTAALRTIPVYRGNLQRTGQTHGEPAIPTAVLSGGRISR